LLWTTSTNKTTVGYVAVQRYEVDNLLVKLPIAKP